MLRLFALLLIIAAAAIVPALRTDEARAGDPVDVTVTILTYQEIDCPDGELVPCPGDYYGRIAIGPHDFVDTPKGPTDDGLESPYWRITKSVDEDLHFIPIKIELHDDDLDGFNPDNRVDIAAGDDVLDMTLDLWTGTWTGDAGPNGTWSTGSGDDSARILFDISLSSTGDIDGDGIPDGVERFGARKVEDGSIAANFANFGTVDPEPADPCRKTVAMQIDYMSGAADGHTHRPKDEALREVKQAYANSPITGFDCPYTQLGFGSDGVQLLMEVGTSLSEQTVFGLDTDLPNSRNANFHPAERPYMHYVVFGHNQAAGSSSSGLCCNESKDFIVTLGSWRTGCIGAGADGTLNSTASGDDAVVGAMIANGPNRLCDSTPGGDDNYVVSDRGIRTTTPTCIGPGADGTRQSTASGDDVAVGQRIDWGPDRICNSSPTGDDAQFIDVGAPLNQHDVGSIRDQSGTIMHELGHSLGLEHRGNADVNHTANYLSNMNYLFQSGIPRNGAPGAVLDYSRDVLPPLDESKLVETDGVQGPSNLLTSWFDPTVTLQTAPANGRIDWNQNGAWGEVSVDINNDSTCITAGGDGTLDSTPGGDDQVANGVIHNGANDICETTRANDDQQPTTGQGGTPINVGCIDTGPNGKVDSTRAGDDILFTNKIRSGPNLRCESTAGGDDVQTVPVGRTEQNIHQGFDDWDNLQYRGQLSASSAGAGAGHPGDITYEYRLLLDSQYAASYEPDLKVSKTVDKADATPGDTLSYEAKAENIGTGTAAAVKYTDTLPDGTAVERTPDNISAGTTHTENFSYTVPCGTADGTVLTNNVTVFARNLQAELEDNTANNSGSASTTIHAPVMTLSKSATASVNAGEAITYVLTYANTGSGNAASVTITDTLPAGVYYSLALDLGSGPKPDTVTANVDGTTTLTWNVGAVTANTGPFSITYTARPTLLSLGGTTYTNDASLTFTDANGCTYPPVTDDASTAITVVTPSGDTGTIGFWGQHAELWTSELLARIQATDQRYDGIDGSTPNGALSPAEAAFMLAPGGNQPKMLQQQMLALYFNLADRRINAGTGVESKLATKLALSNVRDVALYGIATLALPVNNATKGRYSDATTLVDEINRNRSPVY